MPITKLNSMPRSYSSGTLTDIKNTSSDSAPQGLKRSLSEGSLNRVNSFLDATDSNNIY